MHQPPARVRELINALGGASHAQAIEDGSVEEVLVQNGKDGYRRRISHAGLDQGL